MEKKITSTAFFAKFIDPLLGVISGTSILVKLIYRSTKIGHVRLSSVSGFVLNSYLFFIKSFS